MRKEFENNSIKMKREFNVNVLNYIDFAIDYLIPTFEGKEFTRKQYDNFRQDKGYKSPMWSYVDDFPSLQTLLKFGIVKINRTENISAYIDDYEKISFTLEEKIKTANMIENDSLRKFFNDMCESNLEYQERKRHYYICNTQLLQDKLFDMYKEYQDKLEDTRKVYNKAEEIRKEEN